MLTSSNAVLYIQWCNQGETKGAEAMPFPIVKMNRFSNGSLEHPKNDATFFYLQQEVIISLH